MTESYNDFTEKLFLFKDGNQEISVPCRDLAQHQIDGIRFLFKQSKKMKPGVILNYPSGCGTSVQVAVFLQAIHMKLKKPVLILYDTQHEKDEWLKRFEKWTTIDSDKIAVDPLTSYVKKLIHINEMTNLKFCSRLWSIVVIKSDELNKIHRTLIKSPLKADFKIWITSTDMKRDRGMLCSIYSWMYTKSAAGIEVINNTKESYANSLLLDSLLEDVLLTRRNLKPFRSSKRQHEIEIEIPKVTRKNKDATGLKIKRSKKNVEDPSTPAITGSVETFPNMNNSPVSSNKADVIEKATEDEESKLDVESFIRDNEPLESDCHLNMAVKNLDNASLTTTVNSSKIDDLHTGSSLTVASENDAANITVIDTSEKEIQNSSFSIELINDCLSQGSSENESNDPLFSNTMPLIKNVVCTSAGEDKQENNKVEFDKTDIGAENEEASSDESIDVGRDQEREVEITTSLLQETDNSFDSKLKQMEERALKKFKGSFLDNIF